MFKKQDESLHLEDANNFLSDSKENKTDLTENYRQLQPQPPVVEQPFSIYHCITDYAEITRELFRNCRQSELPLICKQIGPYNFWFVIGALYFQEALLTDLARLEATRRECPAKLTIRFGDQHTSLYSVKPTYDLEDDLFVLQNRSLAVRNTSSAELSQARQTPLDELVELWEEELTRVEDQNSYRIASLYEQIKEYQVLRYRLNEMLLPTHYRPEFLSFEYVELEDQQISLSKQRHELQLNNTDLCLMCLAGPGINNTNPLLHCDTCEVSTHSKCYPLDHDPDNFRCYTCTMETPESEMLCVMCCCVGGLLLPSTVRADHPLVRSRFQPEPLYTVYETSSQTVLRLRRFEQVNDCPPTFNMLVHGVCFKWHPELFFDELLNQVSGFTAIRDKKLQSICYICGTNDGSCVDCVAHGCQKTFHAECAQRSGVSMGTVKKADRLVRYVHCYKHRYRRQYYVMEYNRWKRMNALLRTYYSIYKLYSTHPLHQRRSKKPSPASSVPNDRLSEKSRYCVCKQYYRGESMIECEHCNEWYHFECVQVRDVEHFICDLCQAMQQQ